MQMIDWTDNLPSIASNGHVASHFESETNGTNTNRSHWCSRAAPLVWSVALDHLFRPGRHTMGHVPITWALYSNYRGRNTFVFSTQDFTSDFLLIHYTGKMWRSSSILLRITTFCGHFSLYHKQLGSFIWRDLLLWFLWIEFKGPTNTWDLLNYCDCVTCSLCKWFALYLSRCIHTFDWSIK